MDISKLPPWDQLAIERALREAQNFLSQRNLPEADAALSRATSILKKHETPADLQARREARLFREGLESLSPEQRDEFEKTNSDVATYRRLAEKAKRLADEDWEKREAQRQTEEYEKTMWQGMTDRNRLPGADYNKAFELSDQTDQRRKARLADRKQRELAAEAWDEELPRVVATLDREELEIFNRLLENQPKPLVALTRFAESNGVNPLEGINDTAQLYEMGLGSGRQGNQDVALPVDVSNVDDVNVLYEVALKQALENKGE